MGIPSTNQPSKDSASCCYLVWIRYRGKTRGNTIFIPVSLRHRKMTIDTSIVVLLAYFFFVVSFIPNFHIWEQIYTNIRNKKRKNILSTTVQMLDVITSFNFNCYSTMMDWRNEINDLIVSPCIFHLQSVNMSNYCTSLRTLNCLCVNYSYLFRLPDDRNI
jgi:hypothetical protein